MRAISHRARRRILLLADRDAIAAGELSEALGLANATTSEHLKVLRKCGLVTLQRDGTWRRYRTDRARLRTLERWLGGVVGSLGDHPAQEQR
ncbi:metalloregulator ArsR/SmtB family transcription factor [Conexibacter sp. JD483]|uniref:ArsR/SmtB family transcription factor n=1 Tax=unclassified Conexibacter TaxID=2627773 RepID=UPI002715CCFC|nr:MULTISPECIES: metalloregulator ArsR/SmtB family transcription factor [unclassified Conexibacter]MDO8186193.1 metalloregulator ArsR/SmtB family transcription factor [Conexibacter sp. CPCC 205706]MDO8199740.1 metalloregulator ArsR/SmtB family transcription factor [Conexibacter sp. CPCC 205762]MDR9368168.1 metalloregulator ArsR/SmtB family transcription factor [Conexibacter sp. JD483]